MLPERCIISLLEGLIEERFFFDDFDRDDFLNRLGLVLSESETPCFAWTLIPNHLHLLLRTGSRPHRHGDAQASDRIRGEF